MRESGDIAHSDEFAKVSSLMWAEGGGSTGGKESRTTFLDWLRPQRARLKRLPCEGRFRPLPIAKKTGRIAALPAAVCRWRIGL